MVQEKDAKGNVTGEAYHFAGQELLEFSIVNIPSNPEATRKVVINHARAGVTMLNRIGLPVSEIRKVVNGILDSIEGQEPDEEETKVLGPDPKLSLYEERLKKIKTTK